jgi:hypothetical protein
MVSGRRAAPKDLGRDRWRGGRAASGRISLSLTARSTAARRAKSRPAGRAPAANAILLLAALSFLGLGPAPPATNWGSMLTNGLNYMYEGKWWLIYPAGLAIVLTVIAFNFIGDALRAALEVRLRER